MKKNNGRPFRIPKELLSSINECSFGGFVLFCFDEKGEPIAYTMTDNDVNSMALQYFIGNWSKAIDKANVQTSVDQMMNDNEDEEEK
jgi:hypothetical protein